MKLLSYYYSEQNQQTALFSLYIATRDFQVYFIKWVVIKFDIYFCIKNAGFFYLYQKVTVDVLLQLLIEGSNIDICGR